MTSGGKDHNPGKQNAIPARISLSDVYKIISAEIGDFFGTSSEKDAAHNDAGNKNQRVCISCHGNMKTAKTPWHKDHLTNRYTNLKCSTCHNRKIDTGPRGIKGKVTIGRKICKTCHTQKFDAYTEEHQSKTWTAQHVTLRGDKTGGVDIYPMEVLAEKYPECFKCHKKKELSFCKNCHEQHPHDDAWVNGEHGKQAVATDFACLRCHDKDTWCTTQCHRGVTLPHNIPKWAKHYESDKDAPQWYREHPDIALAAQASAQSSDSKIVCFLCHGGKGQDANDNNTFCQTCHHSQFNEQGSPGPSWKLRHPTVVQELGSSKCQKCHLLEFCAYCHTNGTKPARGTFYNRRTSPGMIDASKLDEIRGKD